MPDSIQSTSPGWSLFVLALAITIPSILFWAPLRQLINEYRLYRRCQQYPHIIVCKENSKTTHQRQKETERTSSDLIKNWILPIAGFLFDVLCRVCGFVMDLFLSALTSVIKKKDTTTTTETPATEPANTIERREERTSTTESTRIVKESLPVTSSPVPLPRRDSFREERMNRGPITKHYFNIQGQPEDSYESSSPTTDNKVDHQRMHKQPYSMASVKPMQQQPRNISRGENTTSLSRPSKRRLSSPMVATAVTVTQPVHFDSSSLSEKMRKRRLNGESNNNPQQEGGTSRKKRRLNSGRMPLQGCVARRPAVGAWQTTKVLDKREREEREERLVRGMSRKRTKPTVEDLKEATGTTITTSTNPLTSAPISTPAPAASTPALNFGTTVSNTSTTPSVAKEKQIAPVSTPAPEFQFGAKEKESSQASNPNLEPPKPGAAEGNSSTATSSQPAPQAPPAFSFGSSSTTTTNAVAAPITNQPSSASAPVPAPQFQFGGSDGQSSSAATTNSQPTAQAPPAFGNQSTIAPAPRAATPAAPVFGAAPAPGALTFGAAATSAAPAFGAAASTQAPAAQAFGATPAALTPTPAAFGATAPASTQAAPGFAPAAPAPAFGAAAPTAFGAAPIPATTNQFGAPTPGPATAPAPQFQFGNTKENTNPGSFNSTFQQAPAPSSGFLKPQPTNGNYAPPLGMNGGFSAGASNGGPVASFGADSAGGMSGFSAGAGAGPVATTGASARRMARKSRVRRR